MNREERVKVFFEAISKIAGFEIKPGKEFYMVENDMKYRYKISENINLYCEAVTGDYKMSAYNISVLFNDKYQFEEIKEPLLTDEEENFLRRFKFEELEIRATHLQLYGENNLLIATIDLNIVDFSFNGLKDYRRYSRGKLGL